MARIAIVGVGAIGSVAAAGLSQSGRHELFLCLRRPITRLTVASAKGEKVVRAGFLTDPETAPPVDWILVATKAYDAAGAAAWFPRLRSGGAPVAIIQNGVEHRERFAPFLPPEAILPAMVNCPAERDAPDRVRQRGEMQLRVPAGPLGEAFSALFRDTEIDAATTPDILTTCWRKLCGNSAGILNAILLKPAGAMWEEGIGQAALEIVRECVAVGRAEGAKLAETVPDEVLRAFRAAPADSINSLHADRLAGRPMELDARNGAIVRAGLRHGIPTPCNSLAIAILESLARK